MTAPRRGLTCTAAAATALFILAPAARAIDEQPADWDTLKACERQLCSLILEPKPAGKDLKCRLAKTWAKTSLKKSESKMVKWGFGDARCLVDLNVTRGALVSALTAPEFALDVPEHKVDCDVERDGEVQKIKAKLAPRIEFKKGRADKVWINLKDVSGPTSIKATVWAAANLEDSLGIFHKSMIKSINKFVHKQCAERYGPNAKSEEAKSSETTPSKSQPNGTAKAESTGAADTPKTPKPVPPAPVPNVAKQ